MNVPSPKSTLFPTRPNLSDPLFHMKPETFPQISSEPLQSQTHPKKPKAKRMAFLLLTAGVLTLLPGCATEDYGGSSYPMSARNQAMQVFEVQVISVRPVKLQGESSIVGVGAGALGGGIAGSMIGSGKASALAAVGGALVGGLAGDAIERKATTTRGLEIMVRTLSGQTWNIVQKDHGENFQLGERVRMLINGDKRIITR
jgi:outer membrane lipoprotein SlyB